MTELDKKWWSFMLSSEEVTDAKATIDLMDRFEAYTVDLDFAEIDRLESLIKEKHPDWKYISRTCHYTGQQICCYNGNKLLASAVIHYFSFGHEYGLLEYWGANVEDPIEVDADDALLLFEDALKAL